MKNQLNLSLVQQFPSLFYRDFNIDCGDGWHTILKSLCESIHREIEFRQQSYQRISEYNQMVEAAATGDFSFFEEYYQSLSKERLDQQRRHVVNYKPVKLPDLVEGFVFEEIKSRYGKLVVVYTSGNAEIAAMVELARTMSRYIVEERE